MDFFAKVCPYSPEHNRRPFLHLLVRRHGPLLPSTMGLGAVMCPALSLGTAGTPAWRGLVGDSAVPKFITMREFSLKLLLYRPWVFPLVVVFLNLLYYF